MVERIEKTDQLEYWQVQASAESRKGGGEDEKQRDPQEEKDNFAGLGEKTDWNLLIDKSRLWKRNIQVARDEIAEVHFQKINLKSDPSLLRIDIALKGGSRISPAFISISRATGLKIKNLHPGDPIALEHLLQNNILWITIPANPQLFAEEEKKIREPSQRAPEQMHAQADTHESELTVKRERPTQDDFSSYFRDPVTKELKIEYIFAVSIPVIFVIMCVWGIFYLL